MRLYPSCFCFYPLMCNQFWTPHPVLRLRYSVLALNIPCIMLVELVRNVMAHAQKPDLVFQRNGRVHLNRRCFQFSRLLAADACASAVVMLDRPSSDTVQDCWLPTPFAYYPFTSPPVRRRVPSDSERAILDLRNFANVHKTAYVWGRKARRYRELLLLDAT